MEIFNEITRIIGQGWFANLIGLVGGFLGLFTFIDSYLINFKPKIYIGTRIVIEAIEEKNFTRLNSIICSLELCNHRKKYGVIYDFAIRIYNADQINSDSSIYYASEIVDKIPVDVQLLQNQDYEVFNPVTVLPESNTSVNFVMAEVLHRSKMNFNNTKSYYAEVYYQKKPKGKWYFVDKLYLFNKGQFDLTSKKYVSFTVLNSDTTREKLKHKVKTQKTSLYTGAFHKTIELAKSRYIYKFIKYPYYRVLDTLIAVPFFLNIAANYLIDKFIKLPLIKKSGRNVQKLNIKFGSPELKPMTISAFDKIFTELQKITNEINISATPDAQITLVKNDRQIIMSRYKLSIKFYLPGDTSIYVQELNVSHGSRLTYNLSLKNKIWNKKYWHLENYGFITVKSFCVRVLDAFIIHSNY